MPTPDELRALADQIESETCTGVAATWCPIHGDCRCPRDKDGGYTEDGLNDAGCPLHSDESSHAEASLAAFREHA